MQNTVINAGVGCVACVMGFLSTNGAFQAYEDITTKPELRLQITHLSFDGVEFRQQSIVSGAEYIPASWTAKITRGDRHLCSGGSDSTYSTRTTTLSIDDWAGDDCPDLQDGDLAVATWTWQDSNGFRHTISRSIVIGDNGDAHEP